MHPFSLRAAAPALPFAFLALALPAQGWVAGPSVATTGNAPRQGGYLVIAPAGTYLLGGLPTLGSGDAPVDKFTGSAWVASTPLESSFENGDAAVDELGRILVIAGVDAGGGLGDSYVWDEQNGNNGGIDDRSNQAPDQGFVCANDDQGRVLSIGGSAPNNFAVADGSGRVERYDANQNAWTVLAPMPTPVADAAACNDGIGHILVFGGYDTGGQRTANVASYDLSTGAWSDTAIPDLPIALAGAEAVLGNDGLVYVIGGSDTNGPLATVHRVDPVSGAWGTAPSMLEPRENFGCAIDAAGYIHVVGGSASQTSETMFTSTCPTIVGAPGARPGFVGLVASLDVVVGGSPPFTYQWRRDGVPLTDGATSYGSVLAGSSSASLTFRGVTPGDAGHAYDCVITNACGSATSPPGTLLLTDPLPLPSAFVVRSLPGGSTGSAAYSIDGDVVVGQTNYVHSQYGTLSRPAKWDVVTGAYSDLTPAGSVGGLARCVRNGAIVGWWWWPYTVQAGTGYNQHAAQWSTAGPFFEMQYSGWEFGSISDTDGQHHAGGCRFDEMSTNSHGFVWTGTSRSGRNLTPSPAWGSGASAIDGDDVFGWVHVGYGVVHAAAWFGPTHDYVDLQPAVTGSGRSYVYDAEAGMQIGAVYFGNNPQPCLWAGTAASYTELTIAGATLAVDRLRDGLLLGSLAQNGSSGPAVFRHGVAEWVELQQFVPPWYGPAVARDLYRDPQSGALTIVGSATNLNTGRPEA
ncbi:MAG: hypothetical protein KDE27_18485, partial [Planctomycetes bacterium]|nr:hypothetical protein [Planctomycetota bacterium]